MKKDSTINVSFRLPSRFTLTEGELEQLRVDLHEILSEKASLDWTPFKENIEQAENPNWEQFDSELKPVHDWRSYITDEVREQWDVIGLEARCIVIHIAQACANKESWG